MNEFEQALAAVGQALVDYDGDGVPDAIVDLPQSGPPGAVSPGAAQSGPNASPQPLERRKLPDGREIERRPDGSWGLPAPTQDEMGRSRQFVAELTGIPSVMRGATNMYEGATGGSVSRFAAGAGEAALGALPGGMALRPVAAALRTAPRAMAALGVPSAAMLPYGVETATANATNKAAEAMNADPEVMRLRGELAVIQSERMKASSQSIKGLNRASADAARARADAAFAEREAAIQSQMEQAQGAAQEGYRKNAPFRERNPGAAETIMTGAGVLAAGLPFAKGLKNNLAEAFVTAPSIQRQTQRVENAMGIAPDPTMWQRMTGSTPKAPRPNEAAFAREQDVLKRKISRYEAGQPTEAGKYAGNVALGASVLMEGRMLPEEIDAIVFPPGHPTREAAQNALTDPSYYASGVVPSLLGGLAAGGIGTKAADILSKTRPDITRGQSAATWSFPQRGPPAIGGGPSGPPVGPPSTGSALQMPTPPPGPGNVPTIGPGPNALAAGPRSQNYNPSQQNALRPFVDSEIMAGRGVPGRPAMENALSSANVPMPTGGRFGDRIDNTSAIVANLQAAGATPQQILAAIQSMRVRGMPVIGAAGAAGVGMNALADPSLYGSP